MATEKELKALMSRFKPQPTIKNYLDRLTHGTPTEWEGVIKPQASRLGSATGTPWFGGEFYATPDINTADMYLGEYQHNIGDYAGDVYGFDYDTSQFYDIHKPFDKQTPRVQRAIYNDIRNNPNSLFNTLGESGADKWEIRDPRYNQLMDDLYKYGVKGISENLDAGDFPTYVFRKASDVPTGISLEKGNTLVPDLEAMNNRYIPDVKYDLRPARNYAPLRRAGQKIGDILKGFGVGGGLALENSLLFLDFVAAVEAAKQSDELTDIVRQGAGNTRGLPDLSTATFTGAKVIEPLPQIQVNQDGSPNVSLQGRVNYDDYYIEPLGDDVYVKRRKTN